MTATFMRAGGAGGYAVAAVGCEACLPAHTWLGTQTCPSKMRRAVRISAARRNSCLPAAKSTSRSITIMPEGCSILTMPWGAGGSGAICDATVPGIAQAEAIHTVPVTGCDLWQVSGTKNRDA